MPAALHLADTHVLIWHLSNDPRLGRHALQTINDAIGTGTLRFSAMSCYELMIASGKPRWPLTASATEVLSRITAVGISVININASEATRAAELSLPHWDPIDRLIAATAALNDMTLITGDEALLGNNLSCPVIDARL